MISETAQPIPITKYHAALTLVETVQRHYTRHTPTTDQHRGQRQAIQPHAQAIEAIIDTAFWTSLRREEGLSPRISLAFLPPEQARQPLLFGQRLGLTTKTLTKLAPGVERPGTHLGVWHEEGELYVWGTTRQLPYSCFVVDVTEPGVLVIKHRRGEGLVEFKNMAVLIGEQVKVIDESSARLPDAGDLFTRPGALFFLERAYKCAGAFSHLHARPQAWWGPFDCTLQH
jgi:hypothetical protein